MKLSIKSTTVTGFCFAFGALSLFATILYTTQPEPVAHTYWINTMAWTVLLFIPLSFVLRNNRFKSLFNNYRLLYRNAYWFTQTMWVVGTIELLFRNYDLSTAANPNLYALLAVFYFSLAIGIHYYSVQLTQLHKKRRALEESID